MAGSALPYILPKLTNPELERRKYVNFLLSLMARRRRDEVVRSKPYELTIDPSTICQLHCPYCEVGAETIRRQRQLMKPTVHREFVKELAPEMFISWYFSTGEPLINRRFAEVVSEVRGYGVFSIVSTNLSLKLSDTRIDEILTCGLGVICVSLDGATSETYSRYRVGGDFELVVHNMRRLIARKRELGLEYPLIEWRFLLFRHNQHEIARAREMAAELGVDLLEFFYGFAPDTQDPEKVQRAEPGDYGPMVWGPALDRGLARIDTPLRDYFKDVGTNAPWSMPPPAMMHKKCDWLYLGATLFPDGSVSPCCVSNNEPDDFGRISSEGFAQVWNNDKYREARRAFVDGTKTALICGHCPLPPSQDYQFRTGLQAILRNAPDWVLVPLQHDPDRFFFDVDAHLVPEVAPLAAGLLELKPDVNEALRAIDECDVPGSGMGEDLAWLRGVLTQAPSEIAPSPGRRGVVEVGDSGLTESVGTGQGFMDELDTKKVTGWAWIPEDPECRLSVTVRINGAIVGRVVAVDYRRDVEAAGKGDGCYGFWFNFPEGAAPRHGSVVSVTIGDRDQHLTGSPRAFTVPAQADPRATPSSADGMRREEKGPGDVVRLPII